MKHFAWTFAWVAVMIMVPTVRADFSTIGFSSDQYPLTTWVINADGTGTPQSLTDNSGVDDDPDWGPARLP